MFTDLFEFELNSPNHNYFPIVYNKNYDISLFGLQRLHPFDCQLWGKTSRNLDQYFQDKFSTISPIRPINSEELCLHYSKKLVDDIHNSNTLISGTAEIPLLRLVPNSILQSRLIEPFKWQTSGSILAAKQALLHGTGINLGGGFHHASSISCEAFCYFADISLIIKYFWKNISQELKFLIIDLDAHQGNGYEFDKFLMSSHERERLLIFDMYNSGIYPSDEMAKAMIDIKIEINCRTSSHDYIETLQRTINENGEFIKLFNPSLIIYNAGTDILSGDSLGLLEVTKLDVIKRDKIIFEFARQFHIPIVLLMSGGYQQINAEVISQSVINLIENGLVTSIKY